MPLVQVSRSRRVGEAEPAGLLRKFRTLKKRSYLLVPHPPFQRSSMKVGKTLNMATLHGGSHAQTLLTLALSYPPYELSEERKSQPQRGSIIRPVGWVRLSLLGC